MKIKLKGIYSPNLPSGYGELPDNPKDCWIVIHADIGVEDELGADCFILYVTTPLFLIKSITTEQFQLGRGLLIVDKFDWDVILDAIDTVCAKAEADSWSDVVSQLSRSFFYEYDEPH